MLITTCDVIPGKQIEVLGLARGNVIIAEYIRGEIMAQSTWPGARLKATPT